ncbi:MAG: hypothetical protein ACR2I5_14620 [Candidatus Limnocylindria bacterium]
MSRWRMHLAAVLAVMMMAVAGCQEPADSPNADDLLTSPGAQ